MLLGCPARGGLPCNFRLKGGLPSLWRAALPFAAGLPYLGRIGGREKVLVASGHAMLGLSMGPVTGKLVAELVAGRSPTIPVDQLAVERFA